MFLLIAPAPRHAILGMLSHTEDWIIAWAPLSYIALMLVVLPAVGAYLLMARWPAPAEPDNPLARYKKEAEDLDLD
jgi:cytochrome c-type biogenesis protein CcmH/NrfG